MDEKLRETMNISFQTAITMINNLKFLVVGNGYPYPADNVELAYMQQRLEEMARNVQ